MIYSKEAEVLLALHGLPTKPCYFENYGNACDLCSEGEGKWIFLDIDRKRMLLICDNHLAYARRSSEYIEFEPERSNQ